MGSKEGKGRKAMTMATRVTGEQMDGDIEGDSNGNEGARQVTAMVMKTAMATAMRVAGNKESKGRRQL
jgi:hypothetical protein